MPVPSRALVAAVIVLVATATGGCSGGSSEGQADAADAAVLFPDVTPQDTSTAGDTTPSTDADTAEPASCPGAFGCTCADNNDCDSGFCVASSTGLTCTRYCLDDCPTGWACRTLANPSADPVALCVPRWSNLCRPCSDDADCNLDGLSDARCLTRPGGSGSFCGAACGASADCPEGYRCDDVAAAPGEAPTRQCLPADGVCECNTLARSDGATTACSRLNASGTCAGSRRCSPDGLTACDAPAPASETCDGLDDDCDGDTDEAFPELGAPCDGADADAIPQGHYVCREDGVATRCDEPTSTSPERCDGVDNDDDGDTDEDWPTLGEPCDGPDADLCAHGAFVCNASKDGVVCGTETQTGLVELCGTAADDDCDGVANEGCPAARLYLVLGGAHLRGEAGGLRVDALLAPTLATSRLRSPTGGLGVRFGGHTALHTLAPAL